MTFSLKKGSAITKIVMIQESKHGICKHGEKDDMDFWFVSLLALPVFCPEFSFPVGLSRWIKFLGDRLCLYSLYVS